MSYVTYPNLPAQQAHFDTLQTRKQQIDKFYDDYKKVIKSVEIKATVEGTVTAKDIPDAPPAITYP